LNKHHGHIAIPGQRSSSRGKEDHLLDTLPGVDERREFIGRLTLPTISPLVVGQDDVVETKAILIHVHEPHGHAAGPSHEPDELVDSKSMLLE
jgi:hypothetical protein